MISKKYKPENKKKSLYLLDNVNIPNSSHRFHTSKEKKIVDIFKNTQLVKRARSSKYNYDGKQKIKTSKYKSIQNQQTTYHIQLDQKKQQIKDYKKLIMSKQKELCQTDKSTTLHSSAFKKNSLINKKIFKRINNIRFLTDKPFIQKKSQSNLSIKLQQRDSNIKQFNLNKQQQKQKINNIITSIEPEYSNVFIKSLKQKFQTIQKLAKETSPIKYEIQDEYLFKVKQKNQSFKEQYGRIIFQENYLLKDYFSRQQLTKNRKNLIDFSWDLIQHNNYRQNEQKNKSSYFKKQLQQIPSYKNCKQIAKQFLTNQQLQTIDKYLLQRQKKTNYEKILNICKNLNYFRKYSKDININIIKNSTLTKAQVGQCLYKIGDQIDFVYLILKGKVKIIPAQMDFIKQQQYINNSVNNLISIVFQGQVLGQRICSHFLEKNHFSHLNNLQDILKQNEDIDVQGMYRLNTAQVIEECVLMRIEIEKYQNILITQNGIWNKINTLKMLPCFRLQQQLTLLPLTKIMDFKYYKSDQVIIQQGQKPNKMFIIFSGQAKIVKKELIKRKNQLMSQKKQKLQFSNDFSKHHHFKKKKKPIFYQKSDNNKSNGHLKRISQNSTHITYQYHVKQHNQNILNTIKSGTLLMTRSLLIHYNMMNGLEYKHLQVQSKVSIISSSIDCGVFIIEGQKIKKGIPLKLQQQLIKELMSYKQIDLMITKNDIDEMKHWQKYKRSVLKRIINHEPLNFKNY